MAAGCAYVGENGEYPAPRRTPPERLIAVLLEAGLRERGLPLHRDALEPVVKQMLDAGQITPGLNLMLRGFC